MELSCTKYYTQHGNQFCKRRDFLPVLLDMKDRISLKIYRYWGVSVGKSSKLRGGRRRKDGEGIYRRGKLRRPDGGSRWNERVYGGRADSEDETWQRAV